MLFTVDHQEVVQKLSKQLEHSKKMCDKREETIFTQASIIEETKQALTRVVKEKEECKLKLSQVQLQRDEMELNFDGVVRSLKQTIEQKQQQIEEMQTKQAPLQDNDLMRLKIRNELEHLYRIDVEFKDGQIEELRAAQQQIRNKLELEKQRYSLLKDEQEIERQRLKDKHQQDLKNMNLKMMQLRDIESMNAQERTKLETLLEEKDLIAKILEDREKSLKSVRQQLDQQQIDRNRSIEQLTTELEQERQIKRRMLTDAEKNQDLILVLQGELDRLHNRDSQQIPLINNKAQEQAYQDVYRQLNDYIRLFEDEKEAKRSMERKLSEQIKQTRQEKSDGDKIHEERVHDLTQQLKEERHAKTKLQNKMKELLQQITILNTETLELRERIAQNPTLVRQDSTKVVPHPDELQYKCKQLKAKNHKLKEKLQEANHKIMQLLQKRIPTQQPLDSTTPPPQHEHQRLQERYDQSQAVSNNYQDFYKLRGEQIDYMANPYQNQYTPSDTLPMDLISRQLRDDVYSQKQRLEDYRYKSGMIYPNSLQR